MANFSRFAAVLLLYTCIAAAGGCTGRQVYLSAANAAIPADGTVNINTATARELERLPNIGRKTAESIVAFREANGPFRRPEHLLLIRGISERRFSEIKRYLRTE